VQKWGDIERLLDIGNITVIITNYTCCIREDYTEKGQKNVQTLI